MDTTNPSPSELIAFGKQPISMAPHTNFFDRERTVAGPGFSRWLVPPAALAVHLSIGQVYAFSVFKLPLTKILGVTDSGPGDWTQPQLAWIFSLAICFLGLSAAIFGRWVERVGPRKTMATAALCFGGGLILSAFGVWLHQLWIIYLGYGVLGGCGLGLGYISPVSTLMKWFPDRPGMATGMAIMGFGGGTFVGSNLSLLLMDHFKSATSTGVAQAFLALGLIYFCYMMFGSFIVRVPAKDWKPAGYEAPAHPRGLVTGTNVALDQAWRTPQFWMLWVVLCFNVTAGIGILEQASPMIQEMFGGKVTAAAAGGFVALLSLFNMGGRFIWSSLSDYTGRKAIYVVYLLLGAILYCLIHFAGYSGSVTLFVAICAVIVSMYGGGFATIPAYLRDLFGTMQVGAIHGRLLTAWSVAGILGPVLVNNIREYLKAQGVSGVGLYAPTMYLMSGLLVIGLICNLCVRPVDKRYYFQEKNLQT